MSVPVVQGFTGGCWLKSRGSWPGGNAQDKQPEAKMGPNIKRHVLLLLAVCLDIEFPHRKAWEERLSIPGQLSQF